jgi:metal-responsive CopG/Arc/MetJ family transcriptional regulator
MISIPDKLLERIDAHVEAAHETRSGFLQRVAERVLDHADAGTRDELDRLLDELHPIDFGGISAAQLIREDRESH